MFTGIVEDIGEVVNFYNQKLTFSTKLDELSVGDSIAVNGVCLTITDYKLQIKNYLNKNCLINHVSVEVSKETISRTNLGRLKLKNKLNLERALKFSSRLGGHIVSGHIDTTVNIKNIKSELSSKNKTIVMTFELPKHLAKYVVEKGSVAIDGVSLTVANVSKESFSVVLIGHTLNFTTLKYRKPGDILNLEVDILAKYVENMQNNVYDKKNLIYNESLLKKLKENGFF